jgi:hypothetical protein
MAHPLQSDVDLCVAAGIDASRLDAMDIYMLSGSIQREVARLRGRAIDHVRAMTDAQRTALREHALGVLPIKRKS